MFNKKAAGEGISWAAGLIAILVIIAFSIVAYQVSTIGEKKPITIDLSSDSGHASELQRIGAYVVSSDFNSSEKGKILNDMYSDPQDVFGVSQGVPVLHLPLGYISTVFVNMRYKQFNFLNDFYLNCKHSPGKYLSFKLGKVQNAK
jgi:hypothetical protein